jgi:S1-C subfamily serine protease
MKLPTVTPFLGCIFLFLALTLSSSAQVTTQMQESTVRILCPEPAENGGQGLLVVRIKLPNGDTFDNAFSSFGTGFVINKDGIIVTNNHVVAPDAEKEVPEKLVLVVQTIGKKYLMHKAKVLWQSANRDVAVIQCPQLKAVPLPLLFDETKSTPSEEVYSIGFPGITDLAVEDFNRSDEVRKQLVILKARQRINELQQKLRRRLTQAEEQSVYEDVSEHTGIVSAERTELLVALDGFLRQAEPAATSWDVTNVIERKSLWKNYFAPTVTKGNIEQISKRHGILGVGYPDVLTIQHSCAIKHGNSGGPLLNAGGQVIGVVGRGNVKIASGDRESIAWATASKELKDWLDNNSMAYTLAQEWRKPQRLPVKIIAAISLAVALAIVAVLLVLVKFNQKPTFTTILRDPRLARVLGTTESKLLAVRDAPANPTSSAPLPGFGKWQLLGRTSKGEAVRIEITDLMFASNGSRLVLGRTADLCHLVVNDTSVSRQHAQIRKDGDKFLVADRNSSNHTAVNGQFNSKAFDEVPLKEGDTLTLGEVRLDFSKL